MGGSIIINEPSVVAINQRRNKFYLLVKKPANGRTPAHIVAIRPLMALFLTLKSLVLLRHFIGRVHKERLVSFPSTSGDRDSLRDRGGAAGR